MADEEGVEGEAETREQTDEISRMSDEELSKLEQDLRSLPEKGEDAEDDEPEAETGQQEAEEPDPERPQPEGNEEVSKLRAQLADLEGKLKGREVEKSQREAHIQRLRTQLGEAKRALLERGEQLEKFLEENPDDPRNVTAATLELREIQTRLEQVDAKERDVVEEDRSRTLFERHFQESDVSMEDIATLVLERDALPAEYVQEFRKNPFTFATGTELIQMGKRAQLEKLVDRMVPIMKHLVAENKELKKKGETVVSRIERELRKTPSISNTPAVSKKRQISARDISALSDAELDELEKSLG